MASKYSTSAAYISGALCGQMWGGGLGSLDFKKDLRGPWGIIQKGENYSFEDVARQAILRHGGDFQDTQFTADTIIRIERKCKTALGYSVHVKEIELSKVAPDFVNPDHFTFDFWN
jgi:hypothetical protein